VNLDIARRTATILTNLGIEAEVLPTTLPPCYRANVFVSIHADGDLSGALNGFKVARASASPIPQADDALVAALNEEYALATGLPRDDAHISRRRSTTMLSTADGASTA
jgi:N-acetylmuramoyl-L-alanine amidase